MTEPRTTCLRCNDELWTALERCGLCALCQYADEQPADDSEAWDAFCADAAEWDAEEAS